MERIKNIPCFSKLSDEQLEKLKKISVIKKYNAKEILFYEGDAPTYLYVLLQGTLKVYKTNHKGQQIFLPSTFARRRFVQTITEQDFMLSDPDTAEIVLWFPLP